MVFVNRINLYDLQIFSAANKMKRHYGTYNWWRKYCQKGLFIVGKKRTFHISDELEEYIEDCEKQGIKPSQAINELYGEYISLLDEVDNLNSNLDYYLDMEEMRREYDDFDEE